MWEYITNTKKKTESEDDPKKRITVSRYGKKDDKNIFIFRLLEIKTEDGPGPGVKMDYWVEDELKTRSPLGYSGSQYFIAVKELVIEWEDMVKSLEICAYIECFQSEYLGAKNLNMERTWVHSSLFEETQLLRFVKPPGRQTTFINAENATFFGLELHNENGHQLSLGTQVLTTRAHEIKCAIKPMFDQNEILPIKNAHITVEIIIK